MVALIALAAVGVDLAAVIGSAVEAGSGVIASVVAADLAAAGLADSAVEAADSGAGAEN